MKSLLIGLAVGYFMIAAIGAGCGSGGFLLVGLILGFLFGDMKPQRRS